MDKAKVDRILLNIKNKTHPLIELQIYPHFFTLGPTREWVNSCFREGLYDKELVDAAFDYFWLMLQRPSVIDTLELQPYQYDCYAVHPLQAKDRLGN